MPLRPDRWGLVAREGVRVLKETIQNIEVRIGLGVVVEQYAPTLGRCRSLGLIALRLKPRTGADH